MNFAGGDYALSASSPYKSAATDGTAVGADRPAVPAGNMIAPSPPGNVVVRSCASIKADARPFIEAERFRCI